MKKSFTLTILVLFLASCAANNVDDQTIRIGWIGPLSGQSAVLGMDSAVAARIAIDEINAKGGINGKTLELIIEDDQYDTTKAVSAYQKLVEADNVHIIIVNTYSAMFALGARAGQDGVLLIDPLDCLGKMTALGPNVRCLATDSESIGRVLAAQANAQGLKTVGVLYWNSDAFMPLTKDVFTQDFKGKTIAHAHSAGEQDFRTTILKMQEEHVDALVFLGYDETGTAMRQARELGFQGSFFATGTITSPSLQEAAKGTAEGTILAFWDAPKDAPQTRAFTDAFVAKQGRRPILDLASYPTYDTVNVLALAMETSDSEDPVIVAAALLDIQGYEGVTGTVSFARDGSMRIQETAHVLKNGTAVALE